jgi:hypothetical protein
MLRFRRFVHRCVSALRYYWTTSKGYRMHPWDSPYVRWRMETFYGAAAANLDRRKFLHLMWRDRERIVHFLDWVAQRRRAQREAGL